ncbi:MAG: S-layer homology domain-containing protein [Bacillota bacterium]|jgi:hypothetical protein|nr:hypothetical protein [Candidatus Fermentithermobacillaceae bacterium]
MNPRLRLRYLAALLVICIILPLTPAFAAPTDIAGHWAQQALERWTGLGIVKGYPDGTIHPDGSITRAEFAALINRTFGFTHAEPTGFLDVEDSDWFKEELDKAKSAGYFVGYPDNTAKPGNFITRQEAAVIFARLLDLSYADGVEPFADDAEIPEWSRESVMACAGRGLIEGYLDGTFRPEANMTRAEVVTVLDRLFAEVANEPGVYGTPEAAELDGSVVVTSPDVTLQNFRIKGDLFIAQSVGEGKVSLINVVVEGRTQVSSPAHITLDAESYIDQMILDAAADISGATGIGTLNINVSGSVLDAMPGVLKLADWVTATIAGELVEGKPEFIQAFGNQFEIDSPREWRLGDLDEGKLIVSDTIGNGSIMLAEGVTEAVYTSPEIHIEPFEYLVMSWNADTPEDTWVEVTASVWLDNQDEWSDYVTWGKWSPFIKRSSQASMSSSDSPYVNISQDEMYIRGNPAEGDTASKIRLKVILHRDDPSVESPVLWYLHGTVRVTGVEPTKVFRDDLGDNPDFTCEVEVPQYSQSVRSPQIAGAICNPTTTAMLLNGVSAREGAPLNLLPEEVAMICYDYRAGNYGSWSFAVATAGSYGYKSYVEYSTIEGIKRHLKSGAAVGASVAYSNDPEDPLYLENATGSTSGHLIVLRGYFVDEDGVEWFISNDAFSPTNEQVRRFYRVDQFENCWSRYAIYVVEPGKVPGVGKHAPKRLWADLKEVEPDKYVLVHKSEPVVTPNSSINSRLGFIAYIDEPEVFSGANTSVYEYINIADHRGDLIPLSQDLLSNKNFKLYVANADAYPGKLFVVNRNSNIEYLALATVDSTDYLVRDGEISPNEKAIEFGVTDVQEFLSGLKPAKFAKIKLFPAGTVVESAKDFNSKAAKIQGVLEAGDFIAVLAWDNETLSTYSIKEGPALLPLSLSFPEEEVSLCFHDFPYTSELLGLPEDYEGTITWASSNPDLISVDENGVVSLPYNSGSATITATADTDGVYQVASTSYTITVSRPYIDEFHWGSITHPKVGETPSTVYTISEADKWPLFWIDGGYPRVTWEGEFDEEGKFKAGEAYSVSIQFQTNEFPGGNSAYFFSNPFTADMIAGLPQVGDDTGTGATITAVTVTRNYSYRVTVRIEYSPLQEVE